MKVYIAAFSILLSLFAHTTQAQQPGLRPARALGVDLANTSLNRPSPDQKSYTYWTPETTDEFFPSLLGLRTSGARAIRTKHFNIYFTSAEKTARHIADFADDILDNLMRHYQLKAGLASPRRNGLKRTYRHRFLSMRTLRFLTIHLPARVARPAGRRELRIAIAPSTRKRLETIEAAIAA